MAVFKCKMCGGALEVLDESVMYCRYCGTKQTLPKLPTERKEAMYDRAGQFRQNNEYDKAAAIYEQIIEEDPDDCENYWSLVLCRYGIEYVYDSATDRRIPTVNRAQFTSIYDDMNYKAAIARADASQRLVYEQEAKTINEIQKGILEISDKEEPFDVFICYKETDEQGRRTRDSVLANELYHQLSQEGFKVFFSRITLEDKLGCAYEPYIFAALNSAKVMVVIGTKPEYIEATWVKNEWSRYLALIRAGEKKLLIPAYKDMDPYDLPDEFSHLQAQDMSKLGFMQDLIRGIRKIIGAERMPSPAVQSLDFNNNNVQPLIRRLSISLEDGEWSEAASYCESILNIDPECAQVYLSKLMIEYQCHVQDELMDITDDLSQNLNYKRFVRFGSPQDQEFLQKWRERIEASQAQLAEEEENVPSEIACPYCGRVFTASEQLLEKGRGNCPYCGKELVFDFDDEEDSVQICSVCGEEMIITDDDYLIGTFFCKFCGSMYRFDEKEESSADSEHIINCATCRRDFEINDTIAAYGQTICPYCSARLAFNPYGVLYTSGNRPSDLRDSAIIGQIIEKR